jgi:hypothetical protein
MQDYIKELEQQNERLKESLALFHLIAEEHKEQVIDFTSLLPVWYEDLIDRKIGRKIEQKSVLTYGSIDTLYRIGWIEQISIGWVVSKDVYSNRTDPRPKDLSHVYPTIEEAQDHMEQWFDAARKSIQREHRRRLAT